MTISAHNNNNSGLMTSCGFILKKLELLTVHFTLIDPPGQQGSDVEHLCNIAKGEFATSGVVLSIIHTTAFRNCLFQNQPFLKHQKKKNNK